MTITSRIIEDSVSNEGIRLTTFQLRYPRFIHAELMTHRVFSRNASSSRAIPVKRLIQDIIDDTAMPIHWGKNQKGMQADEECDAMVLNPDPPSYETPLTFTNEQAWLHARDKAIDMARCFDAAGYHKQIVNRLLEPFSHINTLVTSTSYANWYKLRDHKDAQPEIDVLAKSMKKLHNLCVPRLLQPNEWHLPYITAEERKFLPIENQRYVSVARSARVSYLTHDEKKPVLADDMALFTRLVGSEPLHASPTEHQATPDMPYEHTTMGEIGGYIDGEKWRNPDLHGNFTGWIQNRKNMYDEYTLDPLYDISKIK